MSEATATPEGSAPDTTGSAMPVAKKWAVDVLETSRRIVTVESFTRSEAKQRAKNASFWIDKGEATDVVRSKPEGQPRELDKDGNVVPPRPAPAKATPAGKK